MYIKKILLSIIFFTGLTIQAQEDLRFTLEECIRYAGEHNYSLQSSQLDYNSSEINYRSTKEQIAPTISASASQGFGYSQNSTAVNPSWTGSYGLNANMNLFNGLNTYNSIKQSKINLEKSELSIEQAKNALNIQIINAYLSALMNQELLNYQQEVFKSSEEQLKQGETQYKVGKILESDYLLLQAQYTSDLYNIDNTRINFENDLLTLRNLLSIKPEQKFNIIAPDSSILNRNLTIPSLDEVMLKTLNYLPELKISEKNIEVAEYDVKIAKSSYYPNLGLNAGISTGYSNGNGSYGTQLGNNLGESVSLNLNIPIYSRSSTRYQVKLADINLKQAKIENEQTQLDINQKIKQNYLNVSQAYNNYKVSEVQKKAYYASYQAYSQQFRYGAITTVDLLQQQTNYLNQLNQYLQDKYSFVLIRKILDIYMGNPVSL